jgi:hypothetical protein
MELQIFVSDLQEELENKLAASNDALQHTITT